jgi:hypothetical protein
MMDGHPMRTGFTCAANSRDGLFCAIVAALTGHPLFELNSAVRIEGITTRWDSHRLTVRLFHVRGVSFIAAAWRAEFDPADSAVEIARRAADEFRPQVDQAHPQDIGFGSR